MIVFGYVSKKLQFQNEFLNILMQGEMFSHGLNRDSFGSRKIQVGLDLRKLSHEDAKERHNQPYLLSHCITIFVVFQSLQNNLDLIRGLYQNLIFALE